MGGEESRKLLESLTAPGRPFGIQITAVVALAGIDLPAAAARAAEMLATAPAGADPAPLVAGFLQRKNGPISFNLPPPLANRKLSADIAKLSVRAVRASASEQPALVATLSTDGGLATTAARMPRGADLERMVAEVRSQGDPARGEAIFRHRAILFKVPRHRRRRRPGRGSVGHQRNAIADVDYLISNRYWN